MVTLIIFNEDVLEIIYTFSCFGGKHRYSIKPAHSYQLPTCTHFIKGNTPGTLASIHNRTLSLTWPAASSHVNLIGKQSVYLSLNKRVH